MFYTDWWEALSEMTGDELRQLLAAMVAYTQTGAEPQFEDRLLRAQWALLRPKMLHDRDRYERTCKMRQEAANKRWSKPAEQPAPKRSGGLPTRREMDDSIDKYLDW